MKAPFARLLLSILLIALIGLASITWQSYNQISELKNQNISLKNQNSILQNQTDTLQIHNSEIQNQLSQLQRNVSDLQNQTGILQNQNNDLQNQNNELKNQLNQLQNQTDQSQNQTNQTSNTITKKTEVTVYNISSNGPTSIVFAVSEYDFYLTVKNTGNAIISNMTLEVNLTLSDGEKPNTYWSTPIEPLDVGEVQQISGWATVQNVVVNLYGLHQNWSFAIKTPEGTLIQQTFYS